MEAQIKSAGERKDPGKDGPLLSQLPTAPTLIKVLQQPSD